MESATQQQFPILVVDDDIWIQRILSKVLSHFGFYPLTASNGFDGVALAIEHQPMAIFLDLMMPELSGHLVLKLLKRIKLTRDIPVLVVTALSDTENLSLAIKEGAIGFVSKPFTRATIYDKLLSIFGSETLEVIAKQTKLPPAQETTVDTTTSQPSFTSSPESSVSATPPEQPPAYSQTVVERYKEEEAPPEEEQLEIIRKILEQHRGTQ